MVPELERLIQAHQNIVFFWRRRGFDGKRHPRFSLGGRALPPKNSSTRPKPCCPTHFMSSTPQNFFDFYRQKLIVHGAKPNAAHLRLAKLEREGKLKAVVTQNIDGLHQAAGSKTVYELHGSTLRNYCTRCGKFYPVSFIEEAGGKGDGVPRCTDCGGIVKPDVVLYEEGLDEATIEGAVSVIRRADMLIVGGTSLAVYPAAGLIRYFRGDDLVVINKQPTPADGMATLLVNKPIGQALSETEGKEGQFVAERKLS